MCVDCGALLQLVLGCKLHSLYTTYIDGIVEHVPSKSVVLGGPQPGLEEVLVKTVSQLSERHLPWRGGERQRE